MTYSKKAPTPHDIEKRSIPEPNTGCWIWLNYLGCRGQYGHFRNNLASRASFIAFNGYDPIGLDVDHICHNSWCVNPDHLQAITHLENCARRAARTSTCKNGHVFDSVTHRPNGRTHRRCSVCLSISNKNRRR
jgi:hypothetical protein